MSTAEIKKQFSPKDLLTLPDAEAYELIDGELVEKVMSTWSSYVAGLLYALLQDYCRIHSLGWVLGEGTTYQCFPGHPRMVRRADVSFIRKERLSVKDAQAEGHLRVAPDLAAEVLSPGDLVYKVDKKIKLYLEAGVHLIWVVRPEARTVEVHRADGGPGVILGEKDEISGEDVIPGFICSVAALFKTP